MADLLMSFLGLAMLVGVACLVLMWPASRVWHTWPVWLVALMWLMGFVGLAGLLVVTAAAAAIAFAA